MPYSCYGINWRKGWSCSLQNGVHWEIWSRAWQISGANSTEWRTQRDLKQSLTDFWSQLNRMDFWSQLNRMAYTARSEAELNRFLEPAQQNAVHWEIWSSLNKIGLEPGYTQQYKNWLLRGAHNPQSQQKTSSNI